MLVWAPFPKGVDGHCYREGEHSEVEVQAGQGSSDTPGVKGFCREWQWGWDVTLLVGLGPSKQHIEGCDIEALRGVRLTNILSSQLAVNNVLLLHVSLCPVDNHIQAWRIEINDVGNPLKEVEGGWGASVCVLWMTRSGTKDCSPRQTRILNMPNPSIFRMAGWTASHSSRRSVEG